MGTGPLDQLLILIGAVMFGFKVFALIDCAMRPAGAFALADKQTKGFWLILLGLAAAWDGRFLLILQEWYFRPLDILPVVGIVAALVYVLDARPAVRSHGGGKGGKGRQGPYGSW